MVLQSLAGLPAFLLYFCISSVAVIVFLLIYTRITAHDEFDLLTKNNPGAAIALGLSMLGFALPVASAEGFVRQALASLPQFEGNHTVLGSWIAAGKLCGLNVREDASPITRNSSRFLPHAIVG